MFLGSVVLELYVCSVGGAAVPFGPCLVKSPPCYWGVNALGGACLCRLVLVLNMLLFPKNDKKYHFQRFLGGVASISNINCTSENSREVPFTHNNNKQKLEHHPAQTKFLILTFAGGAP